MGCRLHLVLWIVLAAAPVLAETATDREAAFEAALAEGRSLMGTNDHHAAIKAFKKAQELAEKPSFEAALWLADAYNQVEAFKSAEKSARQAIELAPDPYQQATTYNTLGVALFANGTAETQAIEEAVATYRKTLELDPEKHEVTRYNLGLALLKLERDEEGVAMLQAFLDKAPAHSLAERARSLIENPRRARVDLLSDFEIATLNGDYVSTTDLRGKVVLIDFWGTWCPPCVESVPHLRLLNRRSVKDPFVILSISNDGDGPALRKFVGENEMSWPQIWDEQRQLVSTTFGVNRFPTFWLVDHEGAIIFRQSGWSTATGRDLDLRVAAAIRAARKAAKKTAAR